MTIGGRGLEVQEAPTAAGPLSRVISQRCIHSVRSGAHFRWRWRGFGRATMWMRPDGTERRALRAERSPRVPHLSLRRGRAPVSPKKRSPKTAWLRTPAPRTERAISIGLRPFSTEGAPPAAGKNRCGYHKVWQIFSKSLQNYEFLNFPLIFPKNWFKMALALKE